jgi:hypothetical protein
MPGDPGWCCPRCGGDWDDPRSAALRGRMVWIETFDGSEVVCCEACVEVDEWLVNQPDDGSWGDNPLVVR